MEELVDATEEVCKVQRPLYQSPVKGAEEFGPEHRVNGPRPRPVAAVALGASTELPEETPARSHWRRRDEATHTTGDRSVASPGRVEHERTIVRQAVAVYITRNHGRIRES
jgi:hypothetical protein